jgi:hypothetical protein
LDDDDESETDEEAEEEEEEEEDIAEYEPTDKDDMGDLYFACLNGPEDGGFQHTPFMADFVPHEHASLDQDGQAVRIPPWVLRAAGISRGEGDEMDVDEEEEEEDPASEARLTHEGLAFEVVVTEAPNCTVSFLGTADRNSYPSPVAGTRFFLCWEDVIEARAAHLARP